VAVDDAGQRVIQAPKPEPRIMRYELTDYEWKAIKPFLPNKPRGVPRVNDRLTFLEHWDSQEIAASVLTID
jgi:hypothetical protein